jgi:hypothetical protein
LSHNVLIDQVASQLSVVNQALALEGADLLLHHVVGKIARDQSLFDLLFRDPPGCQGMKGDVTGTLANAFTRIGIARVGCGLTTRGLGHSVISFRGPYRRGEGYHYGLSGGASGGGRDPLYGERDDDGIAFPVNEGDAHALGSLSLAFANFLLE